MTVLDYGMGNVGSIVNMLKKLGVEVQLTTGPEDVLRSDRIVLPGVGAFDAAMTKLRHLGYAEALTQRVVGDGIPILGICLGMQVMGRGSEEGREQGLGWLDATAVRFRFGPEAEREGLRVPHMGWNTVQPAAECDFFPAAAGEPRFYFVHSYHLRCNDAADVMTRTTYGEEFVSGVRRGNILGTQFHPEKSHRFGLQFFRAFASWSPAAASRLA